MNGEAVLESDSVEATREIGRRLGEHLRGGEVIALVGPLGAGKTQFVKGLAAGLGVADERVVTSPTFVLCNEYRGRLMLYHLDAYRLTGPHELDALGFAEMCDAGGVVVVEWAERMAGLIPAEAVCITLTQGAASTHRRIVIQGRGKVFRRLVSILNNAD